MKAVITNYRCWVLGLLATAAFILAVAEPSGDEHWLSILLLTKFAGLALVFLCYVLYLYWSEFGLTDKIGEVEDERFDD